MNDHIDTSRWQRLGALFEQACDLDGAGQADLLSTIARDDPDLARALASMLEADTRLHASTSQHRERLLGDVARTLDGPVAQVGDRVGPYELREVLGEGGMGKVFRAERVDGQVRQEVALKVLRGALLDATGRDRFLREREIVAGFQHPCIARMLDVGQTADGSPYLAMELVRGGSITAYCDSRQMDTRARLALFLRVCDAVQHAHANLVLHRDIKPNNVLVGEDGLPRLIDFGIAKPLSPAAGDDTRTGTQQRFFSPGNAAPEQLRGERIGIACDVYQLGTLLHEMLSGTMVFDTTGITPGQLEQRIVGEVPAAPSVRAATVDEAVALAHGAPSPAALGRELRGDLDAIVARGLRKAPGERYASVEQLGEEVKRFLDGRPVLARRGQRWYRAHKFLRRNALAVGLASAAIVLVAVFVTALWMQSRRIERERNLAEQHAKETGQIADFQSDMLNGVDPARSGVQLTNDLKARFAAALATQGIDPGERERKVAFFAEALKLLNATDVARAQLDRDILAPAVAAVDQKFRNQPLVAATLRQELGASYGEMGQFDEALPLLRSALATRRRQLGPDDPLAIDSVASMAGYLDRSGRPPEALPYYREALERRRRVLGANDPETVQSLSFLGDVLQELGKFDEAERIDREALDMDRRILDPGDLDTQRRMLSLGRVLESEGKFDEAERYIREASARIQKEEGPDNPEAIIATSALGTNLRMQHKSHEAEPYVRDALDRMRRILGEDHPATLEAKQSLAMLLEDEGSYAESERMFRESLEAFRKVNGEKSLRTLRGISMLASVLWDDGQLAQAESSYRESLQKNSAVSGPDSYDTVTAMLKLGGVLVEQGKLDAAEPLLQQGMQISARLPSQFGPKQLLTMMATGYTGGLRVAQGRLADAESVLAPLEAASLGNSNPQNRAAAGEILLNLGRARTGLGKFDSAERDLLAGSAFLIKSKGVKSLHSGESMLAIVDLYDAWNRADPGKGHDRQAAEWRQKLHDSNAILPANSARAGNSTVPRTPPH